VLLNHKQNNDQVAMLLTA